MTKKETREHGLIFGRGEALGENVEEPPMSYSPNTLDIPGYSASPMAFNEPPKDDVELEGEIPWELRDDSTEAPVTPSPVNR
jgi:hypothetical protein